MLPALLFAACTIGETGPAPAGTVAADEVATVSQIASDAEEIARLAAELTAQVDESRRAVEEGRATEADEVARMCEMTQRIRVLNEALQAKGKALDERLHERAADPAWPPGDPEPE